MSGLRNALIVRVCTCLRIGDGAESIDNFEPPETSLIRIYKGNLATDLRQVRGGGRKGCVSRNIGGTDDTISGAAIAKDTGKNRYGGREPRDDLLGHIRRCGLHFGVGIGAVISG